MRIGIVGAGISGTYLASLLGRQGFEVMLFDPRTPWEKPCGGGITYRTFSAFSALDGFRPHCLSVQKMRMISADGESSSFSCPDPILIASRRSLGEYLLEDLHGVQMVRQRVDRFAPDGAGWRLHAGDREYQVDFLVGADGVNGLVRRGLVGRFEKKDTTLAVGYWMEGDPEEREAAIGFVSGISGYIWLFPRKGHLSVGVGARVGEATGKELYTLLDDFIERHFPDLIKLPRTRYAALIPSLTRESFTDNRICGESWGLIGDAAGLVDPLTGEGIYYAFRSAELLFGALDQGRIGDYQSAYHEEMVPELVKASSYVRTFFNPKVTSLLVRLSREQPSIQKLLANLISGKQGYLSLKKELLKALPGLAREILFG